MIHRAFFPAFFLVLFCFGPLTLPADQAQPKLPTTTLTLGNHQLVAEVADTDATRQRGMMFRTSMADGEAMLFLLNPPGPASFWMRNTSIPLSIAYLNPSGLIMEIHDLKPHDETPVPSSFPNIGYAIEVPQGWFSRVGIYPGTTVTGLPPLTR